MENPEHVQVQLGQKAVFIRNGRCLILEGSLHSDIWDLPGGRLHIGEDRDSGLKRELEEELGLITFTVDAVIDYHIWDRGAGKSIICLVANLISSAQEEITLSSEHKSFRWITPAELNSYTFYSDGMPRMIRKGFEYLEKTHAA